MLETSGREVLTCGDVDAVAEMIPIRLLLNSSPSPVVPSVNKQIKQINKQAIIELLQRQCNTIGDEIIMVS